MHKNFVEILKCPLTGQSLDLVLYNEVKGFVYSGLLISQDKKYRYPIKKGLPCFAEAKNYTASFEYEWKKWPFVQYESENIGGPMEGHTTKMFKAITRLSEKDVRGKLIVEYGCGTGRFIDVLRKMGGIIVGIEMSQAAYIAQEKYKNDKNVLIVQADFLNAPFKDNCFNIGYSIGALHHTPNPADNLRSLARLVNPGGTIAISVYTKQGFYNYPSLIRLRKIRKLAEKFLGYKLTYHLTVCYAYLAAFFLYYIIKIIEKIPTVGARVKCFITKKLLVCIILPDIRWRLLDIFDAISPRYASAHTPDEIKSWFKSAGIKHFKATDWGDTSFIGIK